MAANEDKFDLNALENFNINDFIDKLHKNFVNEKEFVKLNTNEAKINYLLEIENIKIKIFELIRKFSVNNEKKDLPLAKRLRISGDKCLLEGKYPVALKLYNQAIFEIPLSDEENFAELTELFSNRSTALFMLREYDEAIACIDNAFLYVKDEEKLKSLNQKRLKYSEDTLVSEREINVSTIRKNYDKKFSDKLNTNSESNLSSAEKYIKQKSSDDKGRYLVSEENLMSNEIIITEKPFTVLLDDSFIEKFCSYCLCELKHKLFPCRTCKTVRYCSLKCSENAFDEYHQYECKYERLLKQTNLLRLALRILLIIRPANAIKIVKETNFGKDIDSDCSPPSSPVLSAPKLKTSKSPKREPMNKTKVSADSQNLTDKLASLTIKKDELKSNSSKTRNDYIRLLKLIDHSEKMPVEINIRQSLIVCLFLYLVVEEMKMIDFSDNEEGEKDKLLLGAILLKHLQQISVNLVSIFYQPIYLGPLNIFCIDTKNMIIGNGLYLTTSLINHSCLPNCDIFFSHSTIQVRSITKIRENEEINISYGPLVHQMSRFERRQMLLEQYFFECYCRACLNDFILNNVESCASGLSTASVTICLANDKHRPYQLLDAIICSKCSGPLIVDKMNYAQCLQCNYIEKNEATIKQYFELIKEAKRLHTINVTQCQYGTVRSSEKYIKRALDILTELCYKHNRLLLFMYNELYYYYLKLNELNTARTYLEKCSNIKTVFFDENSIFVLISHLQLVLIKWTLFNEKINESKNVSAKKKIHEKLITESEQLILRCKSTIKSKEIVENLFIGDSNALIFLNEFVRLLGLCKKCTTSL